MLPMLYRVCWNREDWQKPSGEAVDGGYPTESRFGHEEWNFRNDDSYNGFVYGYTYYKPPEATLERSGGHFKIYFWSREPHTKEKLIVGLYGDATPIAKHEFGKIDVYFRRSGIYQRRADELQRVVPSISHDKAVREVRDAVLNRYLTFKCRPEDIEVCHPPVELSNIYAGHVGGYFTRPTFLKEDFALDKPAMSERQGSRRVALLSEDSYLRVTPEALKIILPQHKKLSNEFCSWLKTEGIREIVQEQNRVDVEFADADQLCRAELKVCDMLGTRRAIREALGQLLEYNFYPGRTSADRFAIVLDSVPMPEDVEWLGRVAGRFRIPMSLYWKSDFGFSVRCLA